ncbi:MAG: FkbM family methyltransferase [Betaproteobacteria bacterium]|nr:FkbM family methyltransferase [Betaproteobacteria bacterium]MDH3414039.1 FkbM family methyltransferase [Gammaproteobacteria bacterium]
MNYSAPLTAGWVAGGAFTTDPFVLIDVGASGGIENHWRLFEPDLHAFGFDPLVRECQRLNHKEKNDRVHYYDYFVGSESYSALFPLALANEPVEGWTPALYERSSAVAAQKIMAMSFEQRFNSEDPEVVYTEKRISLDRFCRQQAVGNIDFVKIDTDGHDYEVLLGAEEALRNGPTLGLFVECQLHGVTHLHSNVFANIDRFLRDLGFSLFDLEIYRYTRAALPGHFVYTIPAQTVEGQVLWGDALYFRDIAAPGYSNRWALDLSPAKLLKLACLFEIYGLPDCAADLLLSRQEELGALINVPKALDVLACEIEPAAMNYQTYKHRFETEPARFYPNQTAPTIGSTALLRGMRSLASRVKRRLLGG